VSRRPATLLPQGYGRAHPGPRKGIDASTRRAPGFRPFPNRREVMSEHFEAALGAQLLSSHLRPYCIIPIYWSFDSELEGEMDSFSAWFAAAVTESGQRECRPHPWQRQLADSESCVDRLIHIPTGLGKTLGVLLAWSYHRLHRQDTRWPRRLVWCLPMRTLVDRNLVNKAKELFAAMEKGLRSDVPRPELRLTPLARGFSDRAE
jgi:Rad3-related DNA helicase